MTAISSRYFIAVSLFAASPAIAQNGEAPSTDPDTIIVTASRAPLDQRRVGSATTVITRDQIEQRQLRYLSDLLRSVPGFGLSLSGGIGAQTQARPRGGEANHVLVMIDGVRANDPATGDEFRWEHMTLGNVERVEIVRAPQSALWGSDAVSGVVNIITRTGEAGTHFDGHLETGSNDTQNFGFNGTGGRNGWTLNGSVESLDTDGSNIARVGNERDGADLIAGGIGFGYEGTSGLGINASIRASEATSHYDNVDFFTTGLPVDTDVMTDSDQLTGRIDLALATHDDSVAWNFRVGYFDSEHVDFLDGQRDTSAASSRMNYALQASVDLGSNLLTLAAEHETTDFEQRGPIVFGDPNQDQSLSVTSTIAEYQHLAGNRLTWIIGARHDSNSDFDDALTGRISIVYALSDATRLRAGAGTGQKAPSFIERFGYFPTDFIGNPDLKPETSISYDIGIDHDFADSNVTLSASIYRQQLDDEINGFALVPDTFQFTAVNLPGTSEREGLEVTADWSLSNTMSFGAAYAFTDASEPDSADGRIRELRRPRHSGNLSFNWNPVARPFGLSFVADYGGTRVDEFFPPWPEPSRYVSLDEYWLVDLTAQFELTPSLTLFVRGANLLGETYEQVYGYATPDRTAYVGVRTSLSGR